MRCADGGCNRRVAPAADVDALPEPTETPTATKRGRRARGPRRSPPITVTEFETLLAQTLDPRGRLFLLILGTLAPRIHALAALRWHDIVEPDGRVRSRWCLVEKFGRHRWVFPRSVVTDAVQACILADGRRPSDPVFARRSPTPDRPPVDDTDAPPPPPPSLTSMRAWLSRLCDRAGVRRLRPHAFRAFVVNYGVDNGASLESMSRFLGHVNVETTARYYWTSDRVHAKVNALFDADSSSGDER